MKHSEGLYFNLRSHGVGYFFDNKLTPFSNTYFINSSVERFVKRRHLSTVGIDKEHILFLPKGVILWPQE